MSRLRSRSAALSSGVFLRFFIVVLVVDNCAVDLVDLHLDVEEGFQDQVGRLLVLHTSMVPNGVAARQDVSQGHGR